MRLHLDRAVLCMLVLGGAATPLRAQAHGGSDDYLVRPAAGSLPLPHHDPAFTAAQLDSVMRRGYVLNSYGLYQDTGERSTMYLHDGIDFALPNGTRIFAVADGIVRQITRGPEYTRSILIEDAANPRLAWSYTHVDDFQVEVGSRVTQGTFIARVHFFPGVSEHLHLDRVHRPDGVTDWSRWAALPHLNPANHFALPNREAPAIDPNLRFFANENDAEFMPDDRGVPVLRGDVDIVAGMRERGAYARLPDQDTTEFYFGDRAGVTRIAYEIRTAADDRTLLRRSSFDFSKLEIMSPVSGGAAAVAGTVFKHFPLMRPAEEWRRTKYSYYIVTNVPEDGPPARVLPEHGVNAWRTAAVDESGQALFPDGDYVVLVRAVDGMGNRAEERALVRVRNSGEVGPRE